MNPYQQQVLVTFCKDIEVVVTTEEAKSVEMATKNQAETKLWNQFRSGRITASRMYAACHSSPAQPSESLIKAICKSESAKFVSAATSWGCSHEKDAREIYCEAMNSLHEFFFEDAGLTMHTEYPLFGASPEGLLRLLRTGFTGNQVPYCVRSFTLENFTGPNFCLEDTDNGKLLKRKHPYYYQMQTRIKLCDGEF